MNFIKKFPSWFMFLLYLNSSIIAQNSSKNESDSNMLSGFQIGGNLSAISHNSTSNIGLNIGLYWDYSLSKISDLQIELWYIQKGSLWKWGDSHVNYYITYFQLPIYYSLTLLKNKNSNKLLNIQSGFYLSYAISRESESVYEYYGRTGNISVENIIKKYDYGISFGLQIFTKNNIFIRLIYDHGLSNIIKTSENLTPVDASKAKMWSLILYIGYEGYY